MLSGFDRVDRGPCQVVINGGQIGLAPKNLRR